MRQIPSLLVMLGVGTALFAQQESGEAAPAAQPRVRAEATAALDRTGVAWVLPFAAAKARAAAEHRLLFVPVIAGGTNPTGCW